MGVHFSVRDLKTNLFLIENLEYRTVLFFARTLLFPSLFIFGLVVLTAFLCILNVMSLTAWERTLCGTEHCVVEHTVPQLPDDANSPHPPPLSTHIPKHSQVLRQSGKTKIYEKHTHARAKPKSKQALSSSEYSADQIGFHF